MENVNILLGLLFILFLVNGLMSLRRRKISKKLPPGPFPLPIIGNLHLLGNHPHKSLAQLAKIHGPIMNLKLGQLNTVVISSSVVAREVLQKQDLTFSNRFVPAAVHVRNHSDFSVVWLPVNSRWRTLRKIMNSSIFSGNKLDANQHLRTKKVQELIDYCQKCAKNGESVDIGRVTFGTTLNLLSNTIFSKDLTDPFSDSAKEFKDLVWNMMVEGGKPNLVDYFPFLEKMDPQGIKRRMTNYFTKVLDLISGLIDERLMETNLRDNANVDVLDALLNISQDNPEEIDRNQIEQLCLDLFAAGTDTTTITLEWAMAELLKNPHTLEKAQEELAQVIGRGKLVEEADVADLPYIRCIVKETFRIHTPFLIPRKVDKDIDLCGYIVPKHSQVLVNVWAIGHDSSLWENPMVFKPERFWESEIDVRGQNFELIPFGAGRRICPGLPLAMRMIHVALGSLLNTFNWKLHGGIAPKDLDMEEKFGITLAKAQPLLAIPIPLQASQQLTKLSNTPSSRSRNFCLYTI